MEPPAEQADLAGKARQAWRSAVKLRKLLTKQLEKLPKDNPSGVDISQFEAVDSVLDKFRLACVQTIFLDFEYAIAERADHILWTVHTSINHEYRRTLGRLKHLAQAPEKQQKNDKQTAPDRRNGDKQKADKQSPQKPKGDKRNVEKRKLGDKYLTFLSIAQEFYKGYIQRLSARYDIPELKRIAQGLEMKESANNDIISPVPAKIYHMVLKSCHFTLICLGDLARYQTQAGLRKSSYAISMAYYSLAYDLKTDSGFAFHQMGIISLEESKELDVIYYFYRGIAVADPHPNAKQNLESKFKTILQSDKAPPRKTARAPQDAFITWFSKLHAVFYKGEVPPSSELEREVLHRLGMASKNSSQADVLFKMTLVNMSSYYVASQKYIDAPTQASSQFCQYTLRLNSQFILTFSNILEAELTDVVVRENTDIKATSADKTSATIEHLLPLLRIYIMWLAARRLEIFGAAEVLGPIIPDMVKALAKVFTLLCAETYTQENLATCPYLLSEDVETRGLLPLSPDQVPEECRSYLGENGDLKPHLPSNQTQLPPFQEMLARILDILRCAYFLAEDSVFPLAYKVAQKGLVFEYQEKKPSREIPIDMRQPAVATSSPARETEKKISNQPRAGSDAHQPVSRSVPNETAPGTSSSLVSGPPRQPIAAADHAENTVINMLAPFLKPPTPQPHQQLRHLDESSYGMHTATANEVLGMLHSEASPTSSIPSGKFEPLPWDWVYTPTPHSSQDPSVSMARDAFDGPTGSPNYSSRELARAGSGLEDPFTAPSRSFQASITHRPTSTMMGSPRVASTAEEAHRNSLLQSFATSVAPRTPAFSHWGQNTIRVPREAVSSSWGHQPLDGQALVSSASAFSHPSSLYQGTPANGAAFGMPTSNQFVASRNDHGYGQENVPSSTRHYQMDDTTSSYDAAILQAAFYNNR
ncbi:hypothetical protein B0J13DRAFT_15503 [Dactylonectria estremocensis]|uniref:Nonsense-mediated mRNA decay factor n=1 Tax=Dactylonectria estremocensis TaxID=1079267 RepID=A0A9P9JDN0_9HYPO|nr:hypothetical protein B0J13DRAFT_15503 [Dactylonectria estremocensis]